MIEEMLQPYWDAIQKVIRDQEAKAVHRDQIQEKIAAELTNVNYTLDLILKELKKKK